jgi:transcriptional regulator with XRE-family HTH domain
MQTRIRDVRKAMKLTLTDVAERCAPPTTAQTIGRLETGMRTVSVAWLNRIAAALSVDPSDLVTQAARPDVPVTAVLTARGAEPARRAMLLAPQYPRAAMIGLLVEDSIGDYRSGDQLWLERYEGAGMAQGLNRDCLLLHENGSYCFGRLISYDAATGASLMPLGSGNSLQIILHPRWIAAAHLLVRALAS